MNILPFDKKLYPVILLVICLYQNSLCQCTDSLEQIGSPYDQVFFTSAGVGFGRYYRNPCTGRYSEQCPPTSFLYKTTDTAKTWKLVYSCMKPINLYFLNDSIGYDYTQYGLFKTKDGGKTWKNLSSSTFSGTLFFLDTITGFFGSSKGILKTTDGGHTWDTISSYQANKICFISADSGFAVGTTISNSITLPVILKTTNRGNTWTPINLPITESLNSISFPDKNHGYVVGANGLIMKTTDGGQTWTSLHISNVQNLCAVEFYNNKKGLVADYKVNYGSPNVANFYITADTGVTWNRLSPADSSNFNYGPAVFYKTEDFALATNNWNLYKITPCLNTTSVIASLLPNGISYQDLRLSVFPNPFTDSFTIQLSKPGNYIIRIYNALGVEVNHSSITGSACRINLDDIGIYYLKISDENHNMISTRIEQQ